MSLISYKIYLIIHPKIAFLKRKNFHDCTHYGIP